MISDEEIAGEHRCWAERARIDGCKTWFAAQAEGLTSFECWPLEELFQELETVRTLTPDQIKVIEEIEAEIERRKAA